MLTRISLRVGLDWIEVGDVHRIADAIPRGVKQCAWRIRRLWLGLTAVKAPETITTKLLRACCVNNWSAFRKLLFRGSQSVWTREVSPTQTFRRIFGGAVYDDNLILFFLPLVAYRTRVHVPISLTGTARALNVYVLVIRFHFQNRFLLSGVQMNAKDMCMVSGRCPCLCNACTSGSIKRDWRGVHCGVRGSGGWRRYVHG